MSSLGGVALSWTHTRQRRRVSFILKEQTRDTLFSNAWTGCIVSVKPCPSAARLSHLVLERYDLNHTAKLGSRTYLAYHPKSIDQKQFRRCHKIKNVVISHRICRALNTGAAATPYSFVAENRHHWYTIVPPSRRWARRPAEAK
ncbi:hypothetical protein IF2G_07302 [Cordyceps javanica]|nr:hypothetical protein IF2G_07302 [Cordyceps javanica]